MPPACSGRRAALPLVFALVVLAACGAATSATKDDATISTRVKIVLLNDPQVGALRIDAQTFQGTVTLSGTVRTQAEADRAIALARTIGGARHVKSELKIVP